MPATTVMLKTHRYEFSEPAMMQLNYFTQVHRYDERKAFKEAWKKWVETADIAQMIASETNKLVSEGFHGDVEDKMFKSVRYYFRKKPATENLSPKEQIPRKKYVGFTGKILTAMDSHILNKIKENLHLLSRCSGKCAENICSHLQTGVATDAPDKNQLEKPNKKHFKSNVSPDKAFNDFYNTNTEIIREDTKLLQDEENMDDESIELKIKKTYKNRYQTIRKKLQA
jgi:hypothetical protein